MNIIQVKIDFEQGICQKQGISVITGDYNSTKVVFEFNESATGTKIFKMKDPNDNLVYADEIIDNEVVLVGYKEEEGETTTYSLFGEEGDYTFEVSLYQDDGRLTSVCDYITANKEQVIVDGEEVQERITLFDNLMNELSTAIVETNNLDIDAEKVEHTTTVVLTKKDGTEKTIEILDGEKGDKGDKGDPGAIKIKIVEELPLVGEEDTFYLVPYDVITVNELPSTGLADTIYIVSSTNKRYVYESGQWIEIASDNRYKEYIYTNNNWERLGQIGIEVDLTDYVKNTDYASSNKGGVFKTGFGIQQLEGTIAGETYSYSDYQSWRDLLIVSKGTLENVINGKGIVDSTKIKTSQSTTSGEVYDVTYINSMIGDIETLLTTLDIGGGISGN